MPGIFSSLILDAIDRGTADRLIQEMPRHPLFDGFGALFAPEVRPAVTADLGTDEIDSWITDQLTWNPDAYEPGTSLSTSQVIIHVMWQEYVAGRLGRRLDAAFQKAQLAAKGCVICFFGGTTLSVIVGYQRSRTGPFSLQPIAALERPQGVFELGPIMTTAPPQVANAIKAAAHSVDKLVFQHSILIHVDRRTEDVFGPSIDTIVLGEALAEWLEDDECQPESDAALEIGTGSGLLLTLMANAERPFDQVLGVDINPDAVTCTLKNLAINGSAIGGTNPRIAVYGDSFSVERVHRQFDLVVCNPPYLPEPPHESGSEQFGAQARTHGYQAAVTGLDLSQELLTNLSSLLTRKGRLLIMLSSASFDEIMEMVPNSCTVTPAYVGEGIRVPLDIDTLWSNPDWQRSLIESGRVEHDYETGLLFHYLRPTWITMNMR